MPERKSIAEQFVQIFKKKVQKETIIFNRKVQSYCKCPYPNHPKGCPNWNKNPLCPPNAKYMSDILQKYSNFYLFYATFDIASYSRIMKQQHPEWSKKMCRNSRYWQGTVKGLIKEHISDLNGEYDVLGSGSGFWHNQSMESAGIDVFATLKNNNISFQKNPKDYVVLVSLIMSYDELLIH